MKRTLTLFLFYNCLFTLTAQHSVTFYHTDLETALQMARRQQKDVFVDAYAEWCIPCKRMDRIFRDPDVGKVFNHNYINLKLDMDLPSSTEVKQKYGIIFLPTLLILDSEGKVRYKTDQVLDKDALLRIASLMTDPDIYIASESTKIMSSPIENNLPIKEEARPLPVNITEGVQSTDVKTDADEKILYVLDGDNGEVPPEILMRETYFRMELMDGSQYATAEQYLATQPDWSTGENIRFIFDFLYDTRSKMFLYFIENEYRFAQYYDPDQIRITREMLIYQRLNQGLPRPDLPEIITLFGYLYSTNHEQRAYRYYFHRLQKEGNINGYKEVADQYFKLFPEDHAAKYDLIAYLMNEYEIGPAEAADYLSMMQGIRPSYGDKGNYHLILSQLHLLDGNKEEALSAVRKAITLLDPGSERANFAAKLKTRITQL